MSDRFGMPIVDCRTEEERLRETIEAQAAVIEKLREAVRRAAYMVRENTLTPGGNPWALQEIEAMAHKTNSTQILDEVRRAERERVIAKLLSLGSLDDGGFISTVLAME